MHFFYAKEFYTLLDQISGQGEDGVLTYLLKYNNKALSGELADKLRITSGRMANILKVLEKKNYIQREILPDDKRKVLVLLTEKGQEYIEKKYRTVMEQHELFLEQLGEDDAKEYIRLLKKVFHIVNQS